MSHKIAFLPVSAIPYQTIFSLNNEGWSALVWQTYLQQYEQLTVYRQFCDLLRRNPSQLNHISQIPFLPIEAFRWTEVCDRHTEGLLKFKSSGTTGSESATHFIADPDLYRQSILQGFKLQYGSPEQYRFFFLLPSYLERQDSSLVYMARELVREAGQNEEAFFLYEHEALCRAWNEHSDARIPFLLGVTYALLDLAESFPLQAQQGIVMETGGMKGRRIELTREEIHSILCRKFMVQNIHSEYGMTEMLSQAYSQQKGIFKPPAWMRVGTRELSDPLSAAETGAVGGLNIIDLANRHSCAFLASSDLGRVFEDGSFEVLGRADHSQIRGCNLMYGIESSSTLGSGLIFQ